jgi:lipoprotein-releasing system permease protein
MEWDLGWWLLLNVAVMAVSVGMLIGPSFLISHIHPARSIRWE